MKVVGTTVVLFRAILSKRGSSQPYKGGYLLCIPQNKLVYFELLQSCYTWEHSQCESRKVVTWAVAAEATSSRALKVHIYYKVTIKALSVIEKYGT